MHAVLNHFMYFGAALGLLVLAVSLYVVITPYNELKLIRAGHRASAISLGGTIVGFSLVIWSAATHSVGILDMLAWGGISLVLQLVAFYIVWAFVHDLPEKMKLDTMSHGILLCSASIAMGAMNAGILTY